jgi:hypothetical protein
MQVDKRRRLEDAGWRVGTVSEWKGEVGIMRVYAAYDGVIVWSSHRAVHKQGRVVAGCPLVVMSESRNWYEVEEPVLDRVVKDGYPNFWVRWDDTVAAWEVPVPIEENEGCVAGLVRRLSGR